MKTVPAKPEVVWRVMKMKLEIERYEGELRELRKFKRLVFEYDTRLADRLCNESSQLVQTGSTPVVGSKREKIGKFLVGMAAGFAIGT